MGSADPRDARNASDPPLPRTACLDLPALPLQLLLRRHPDWAGAPAVVVDHDKPQGVILWVNEAARTHRILPGMRYAAGLSLCRDLRAGEVPGAQVELEVRRLVRELQVFTPEVEPHQQDPGVFWLGASGLSRLHPSLEAWGGQLRQHLTERGYLATLAVGFTRFGSYAAARSGRGVIVFDTPDAERARMHAVRLDRLGIRPELRDALARLGISTVGGFLDLPEDAVVRRFGSEARTLHRMANGRVRVPLQAEAVPEPLQVIRILDYPEADAGRLIRIVEHDLRVLLGRLEDRDEELAHLVLRLDLDTGTRVEDRLRPAMPTRELSQLLRLVRLRLEGMELESGVTDVALSAMGAPARREQLHLFRHRPRRDLAAAGRALARIRARFGPDVVVRAVIREGHLPEARYAWETVETLREARPVEVGAGTLVRRVHPRPVALAPRARHEPDGWLPHGMNAGAVGEMIGPHLITGGWWRAPVERAYHFARLADGRWIWLYDDRRRRRWFLQGEVA